MPDLEVLHIYQRTIPGQAQQHPEPASAKYPEDQPHLRNFRWDVTDGNALVCIQ